MIFLKTLLSNLRISHSFQTSFSSDASTATLSSLFAKKPSKTPQIPLIKTPSQVPKPSAKERSSLSPVFSTNKPSASGKLPNEDSSTNSSDLRIARNPLTNGKLPRKDKRAVPRLRSERMEEEEEFPKELSPEATMLVSRLIGDGYLKDANFAKGEQLDPQQIPANLYSRHLLKTAAEKFGKEHQEVAKWLSGSELKKVALFGCPSIERKLVFAAKRLRAFFRIQEDVVCRGCKLRTSCKFINKKVGTMNKVVLEDVMRLITVYTLDSVPSQLVISNELKCSVGKLVKEAISLTN